MVNEKETNYRVLKEWCLQQGVALFGVADLNLFADEFFNLPKRLVSSFRFGISLAVRLSDGVLEEIEDRPTQLYFHHYRQANIFLDRVAFALSQLIQVMGCRALPIAASQIIDWEHQRAHLSHKHVAQAAGLGWMGRNNLLIHPTFGARLRLVTVLADIPLTTDHALAGDCGECRRCIKTCPAGAISERQEDFDHRKCFEQLSLFRKKNLVGQFICGVCVKACSGRRSAWDQGELGE